MRGLARINEVGEDLIVRDLSSAELRVRTGAA